MDMSNAQSNKTVKQWESVTLMLHEMKVFLRIFTILSHFCPETYTERHTLYITNIPLYIQTAEFRHWKPNGICEPVKSFKTLPTDLVSLFPSVSNKQHVKWWVSRIRGWAILNFVLYFLWMSKRVPFAGKSWTESLEFQI